MNIGEGLLKRFSSGDEFALTLSSAASIATGYHALPVYEIYKVGLDPYWEQALNLFEPLLGLRMTVIPHFNNKEGGTHDTRFCYLGKKRLEMLESKLDEDEIILGIDEHSAAIFNFSEDSIYIEGIGAQPLGLVFLSTSSNQAL